MWLKVPHTPPLIQAACPQAECHHRPMHKDTSPYPLGLDQGTSHKAPADGHFAENTSTMCLAPHMVSRRANPCKKRSQSRQKTRKVGRISAKVTASRRCRYAPITQPHHLHSPSRVSQPWTPAARLARPATPMSMPCTYSAPWPLALIAKLARLAIPAHAIHTHTHTPRGTPKVPRYGHFSQHYLTWHLTQSMPAGKKGVGTQRSCQQLQLLNQQSSMH